MKWTFVIQQKMKAALLLGCIMVLVLVSVLLSRSNIEGIDKSFSSLYADRLIPTTDIVYLTESLYQKRLLMEKQFMAREENSWENVSSQLHAHNQRIDSLVGEFKKTYLVKNELVSLRAFQSRHSEYARMEQKIVSLGKAGNPSAGLALHANQGNVLFQKTMTRLRELTQIQSSVGKELLRKSHRDVLQFVFLSTIQIVMVIVIGLMVLGLIRSSKMIHSKSEPFHLN
ncbi:MCP four helix bundle domain-containing protein [Salmonirosea aquatica]|uniref:Chemotaxis methyl-accepting receptor HlyB-like 4HB MCP domain-containing protein n=1 Tax=Salmonirosea aquatica TaxID=2654236 RepID=A0A7C9F9V4_9BACT|nr:hypothetical protein [Cytophagaceae bacterium SJW1-29]